MTWLNAVPAGRTRAAAVQRSTTDLRLPRGTRTPANGASNEGLRSDAGVMPNVCAVRVRKGPDGLETVTMRTEHARAAAERKPARAKLWTAPP